MVVLPFSNYPYFTQEVDLDGEQFRFTFDWNHRFQLYTMGIKDRKDTLLITGIAIVMGSGLIRQFPGRGLPAGDIIAVRESGALDDIANGELGSTVQLLYLTETDLASL